MGNENYLDGEAFFMKGASARPDEWASQEQP